MRLGCYEPDDELNGAWTREQLENMNALFVAAPGEGVRGWAREQKKRSRSGQASGEPGAALRDRTMSSYLRRPASFSSEGRNGVLGNRS